MELTVLNDSLQNNGVLEVFESLIWTERYYGMGDFELTAAPTVENVGFLSGGRFMSIAESDNLMIVDHISITTDLEAGNKLIVKGQSLESILNWRIIWNPTTLTGNFQDAIGQLLTENALSPEISARRIPRLGFLPSEDPAITELTIDAQLHGEFLGDAIASLCASKNIGFKVNLNGTNFIFSLYAGADRSYNQEENTFVVFSPENENLLNSDYSSSTQFLKTVNLVLSGGGGDGSATVTTIVEASDGAGSEMTRREMFTNATDITQSVPTGDLTDSEYIADMAARSSDYIAQMQQRGSEELAKNVSTETFTGELGSGTLYTYGVDFFMGDIVQVENEYGQEATSRVIELIRSEDIDGIKVYPTFSAFSQ